MKSKRVLAIFDFCGTLVNLQTADLFIMGLSSRYPSFKRLALELMRKSLCKAGVLHGANHKKFLLRQVSGVHINAARNYAREYLLETLLPKENIPVVQQMKKHKRRGDCIVIVSAGYENYILEYARHYDITNVVATKLEKKNGILTGKILENDCFGREKLHRLSKFLDLSSFDLENSYSYSDHVSDMPLLELVGNRIIVETGKNTTWCKTAGFEILSV